MSEPTAHDVVANGIGVRAWEWGGPSPPALLLHGIGNYGRFWDFVAGEIGGRLRLVAPDARGHGDSDKPPTGYRAEDYVADALAVASALGLERFVLVGHSMGGGHAIALAATHPERVRALVVIDVGPEIMAEGMERTHRLSASRPARFASEVEALAYLRETSPDYSDAVYANRLRWVLRSGAAGGLEWRASQDALLQTLMDRARTSRMWDLLPLVRCPATLIRGTRSNVLSAEIASRMVKGMPRARLVELDARHNVPLDRPAEVALEILRAAANRAYGVTGA